ncbi:MAG: TIR domain-containing protein, partial [Rhodobacteraceae bacterium]|nr:TIR domain-containing protein [Paracoccaceae bacterium]
MQPKGFWSYARGDDTHLDGVLTSLRERLEGEVSMLLGHDVDIFQDIHDLRTGDRWADKLRGELTRAAFLIPVLSPRFFNRDWCREETLTFLRLASENGVTPLVFPIRFVEYDDDESCEVQVALRPFQYEDFSQWRFESDPTAKARLENGFARDVKDQLKLPRKPAPKTVAAPDRVREKPAPISDTAEAQAPARPTPRKVVQELVVDQWPDDGEHSTISAAIKAAKPGARILIRPGTYLENLVLDKPLELIGEGERDEVLVAVTSGNALQVSASLGLVRNMRFLRGQGKGNDVAAWVTAGRCV